MTNKSTKRALVSSLLVLVLCFTMLVGTTFAWFTDSTTSTGNIIKTGNLDIEMFWADGTAAVPAADSNAWTDASATAIFDYDNWEPGYVQVRHIKIANEGSLALKYMVNIKPTGTVSALAEVIDVYFVDPATQIADRNDLTYATKVGTLAGVLNGEVIPGRGDLVKGESDYITIALKMQEEAGNEYMNMSIGSSFSVQILATQLANESDSFGPDYDANATTHVVYDTTKTVKENAAALRTALANATEGDIVIIGAGNWYATKYQAFTVKNDGVTVIGENGAVLGFEEDNANSIFDVYGDNVTIKNLEFNKNYNEANQCILATGAENLTVDSCTFYGKNIKDPNVPTMGIYIFENLDIADDEKNDAVTKYTITNNNFLGAAVGSYKGGANKVTTDPGVATAQVSADMVIANNIFVGANVLIENWRSWSLEANRDHTAVPTIENNIFESPNLCFGNTPHSIYVRCYRQGSPEQILPADYMDNFVANNTVATPANDTVVTYGGVDYVLTSTYGTFYRDNATYGVIAYCYGQSYAVVVNSADEFNSALANGQDFVMTENVTVTGNVITTNGITEAYGNKVGVAQYGGTFDGNGKTLTETGKSAYVIVTHGGTIKNLTIVGGQRGIVIYAPTEDVIIDNVVIDSPGYAINTAEHNGQNLIVTNSTINGWTSLAGLNSVSFTNCNFGENTTKFWQAYGYNQDYDRLIRPYGSATFTECNFEQGYYFDLSALGADSTITLTDCYCNGVEITAENYANYITIELPAGRTVADCIVFN